MRAGWASAVFWCCAWQGFAAAPATDAALALYEARRYGDARTAFQAIDAAAPGDPTVDFHLGRLALWFDDEAAALHHLERAIRTAPDSARVHHAWGDACGLAAQNAPLIAKLPWARRCLAAYERAVALEPDNPAWRWGLLGFHLAAPRIAGGGAEKAAAQAEAIRRLDPVAGRVAAATVCLAGKRYAAAFAEFDAVLQEQPDDFLALYQIGRCAAVSGEQLGRGLAALQRCLTLPPPPGDGWPTRASVYQRIGDILAHRGDAAGAEAHHTLALTVQPDFRPAKVVLRQ